MLISSPCPLSHELAYHNEQTLGALQKSCILHLPSFHSSLAYSHASGLANPSSFNRHHSENTIGQCVYFFGCADGG